MFRILALESYKIFKKWRTYIGFITLAVVIPLIILAFKLEGGNFVNNATRNLQRDFIFVGNLLNAWFIAHLIMNSLFVHIPFLITLVAGDMLAGEATAGTYRILLTRPISRTKILIIKYIATIFYTTMLVGFLAMLSIGLGSIFFGYGDLLVIDREMLILPGNEIWWRFAVAYIGALCGMWVVASVAFFFSSFVENAIGPIIGTMAVLIIFLIVSELPVEFFEPVKPYLFTSYFAVWRKAFEDPINWTQIINWIAYLLAYCAGLFLLTLYYFRRKDVLS
ncbi:MAG: ABC transporter permease [Bacteroidetes bacterium]|nr:ABC transporter permease [Bacteroidota bacterium]MBU1422585.1 ABC transporter permease [Bacteroidota bacterium]MBU2471377.1 ABC transporter permease [Bacteroidota bacterium]MBU2635880.1 ABC transporter permease [Bacteroidota bacterium]